MPIWVGSPQRCQVKLPDITTINPALVHWKQCRNPLNLDNANMAQHCNKLIKIVSLFFSQLQDVVSP